MDLMEHIVPYGAKFVIWDIFFHLWRSCILWDIHHILKHNVFYVKTVSDEAYCIYGHTVSYRDCKCGKPFCPGSIPGHSPHLVAVTWKYKKLVLFTML